MKRFGKIAVCVAGGLALHTGLRAAESSLPTNPLPNEPYAPIVERNVFGLLPPPDPNKEAETNALKDLPKITVSGIYSVFGRAKAIFKASGVVTKPGQAAKDKSYRLSEGEGQDDIEVTHIDQQNSLVTFDNHGVVQELPLVAVSSPGGTAPATGGNPGATAVAPGGAPPSNVGGTPGPDGIIRFSGRGSGFGAGGAPGNISGTAGGANGGLMPGPAIPRSNLGPAENLPPISAEDQEAMIVLQHLKAQQDGDPSSPLYPPTPDDQAAGISDGGPPPPP